MITRQTFEIEGMPITVVYQYDSATLMWKVVCATEIDGDTMEVLHRWPINQWPEGPEMRTLAIAAAGAFITYKISKGKAAA